RRGGSRAARWMAPRSSSRRAASSASTRESRIEVLPVGELFAQQEDVVGLQVPNDRLSQRLPLGTKLPVRQLGQLPRVGLAAEQGREDLAGREAAHIGDDRGELNVGVLEDGLQPVGESGPLVDAVDAGAGQVAQVALGGGGDEAGARAARGAAT